MNLKSRHCSCPEQIRTDQSSSVTWRNPPFACRADMINEKEPLVNTYISVPKDLGGLNCASFVAGVVHGVLESGDP